MKRKALDILRRAALLALVAFTVVSLVTLLIPFSAILLGAAVLGERLEPHHLGGMALILAGLVVTDGRLLRRARGSVSVRRSGV